MTLIVETGAIVANANTYISEASANSILADFGLPALVPANADAQLKTAAQYLETYRARYKGCKVSGTQALQFPRVELSIDGYLFPYNEIPQVLKNAQALICNQIAVGSNLFSNSSGAQILSKQVDVIGVTYADTGVANAQPEFGAIDAQLDCLLKPLGLRSVRV